MPTTDHTPTTRTCVDAAAESRRSWLVALAVASTLLATGCGAPDGATSNAANGVANGAARSGATRLPGFAECESWPELCNTDRRGSGGTMTVGMVGGLPDLDPRTSAAASPPAAAVLALIAPGAHRRLPSGAAGYNTDLLTGAPTLVSAGGQPRVVYRIRPQARWDDGAPISAADFGYTWKIHTAGARPDCAPADAAGYDRIASVTGSDNGKTVTVTLRTPSPDWRDLFAALLPAHVAAAAGEIVTADGVAASCAVWSGRPAWSGGAYLIAGYQPEGRGIEFVPNPAWYGATTPALDRLALRFYPDAQSALGALERGEVDAVDAPADRAAVTRARGLSAAGVETQISGSHDWAHLDLATGNRYLASETFRQALLTAVGTHEVIEKTVRDHFPAARPKRSHHSFPGEPGYRDVLGGTAPNQGSGDALGALRLLVSAGYIVADGLVRAPDGTEVPPLRLRVAADDPTAREAADVVGAQLARVGLRAVVEPAADLPATVAGRDFDLLIRVDRDGPSRGGAIDRWRGGAATNPTGWSDPEADALLDRAAVEPDEARLVALLDRHDEIMTRAAVVLPLYQRPHLLAVAGGYVNIRANVAGPLTYNAEEWGTPAR